MLPAAEQLDQLSRDAETILPESELKTRLEENRPLRVKLGLDPTAPRVTLGWAVVLRKLRQYQELGHTAVLIVGDFTAQVGDPSGRSEERKRLTGPEVRSYAEGVLEGLARVLSPDHLEIRYNSEWLAQLDMAEALELTSKVTVAQMLERDDFGRRFRDQRPISLMEFLYPLLQGMDSVAIEADVELGGADQLWNLMMGRALQERYGQRPQIAMTMPLLVGTDGTQKMSQSLGNYVAIDDPPDEMFGKVMSIPDTLIGSWLTLTTDIPQGEVARLVDGMAADTEHPGQVKRRLAREIISLYWGKTSAHQAEAEFDRVFKEGGAPSEMARHGLPDEDPVYLPRLLAEAGLAASNGEGRRLLAQGAVRLDGERVTADEVSRARLEGATLQVGKRRFVKLGDGVE